MQQTLLFSILKFIYCNFEEKYEAREINNITSHVNDRSKTPYARMTAKTTIIGVRVVCFKKKQLS